MKKFKKLLLTALALSIVTLVLGATAFAAESEDIVWEFTDEASMQGWSTSYLRYNFDPGYFNAYAFEKSANLSDPMFVSPKLNINAEDYRYVVVNMKFSQDATWNKASTVFFIGPGGTFNQDQSVRSDEFQNHTEYDFVNITIDMSKNEMWTGVIDQIRFDPFDTPGSIQVKSIKLTNTAEPYSTKKEEVKEEPKEEVKEEEPEEPKKQAGVFLKPNKYANNFSDIPESEWFAKEVANAYELGLVSGNPDGTFNPNGNMTVAEAVTIAARANDAYGTADYVFEAAEGEEWFTPYVNYCIDKGIITKDTFSDYNKSITRGEMALVFANVLPAGEYAYINSVPNIRDVPHSSPYYKAVYKLYNAGIVMGSDGLGTFNPDNDIIRAEAAAIINRVALKENRLSKNLMNEVPAVDNSAFTMSSEAKYLMDDKKFRHTHMDGIPGGWDLVETILVADGQTRPFFNLVDDSNDYEEYFSRKFVELNDGVIDFQFGARIYGGNGAYFSFNDANGGKVLELLIRDNKYVSLNADGSYTETGVGYESTAHLNLRINLDKNTYDFGMNGAYCGTYPLASDKGICEFRYGGTKEAWVTLAVDYAFMQHNYLAYERFVNAPNNIIPYNYKLISDGGKVEKHMVNTKTNGGGSVALISKANGKTGIASGFETASGNVVFETYVLFPTEMNGAKIALTNGGNEVFSLTTKDGNFVAPDGQTVKYVTKNLWHIVRFEADTATGKALVKINGKKIGTYDFTAPSATIDGFEVTYTPSVDATMYVDEFAAFIKLPYPDDYVPEPVIPTNDDYLVSMNICSLWREGTHYGWEEITAYPEITPVLGYYDEGSPEVSDWEIKMMTEHGIDYQIFCWYPGENITKPIQRTDMNEAIIDGYFNARYSDKMKFAIMWENSAVSEMKFEDFKNYTVPYWIEYFFKDDRYQKIDNKPILTIWQLGGKFADCSVKEAMDYVRQACKEAGFDGCEIFLYSSNTDSNYKNDLDSMGIDGILGYHWGTAGANAQSQANSLTAYSALDYTIPTISVGFDYVGWGFSNERNGLLDPKDYPTMTGIVTEALAKRQASGAKYANMVNISTWNEYGEGTYVMPTERFGFAYLDAVRKAFTKDDVEHNDLTLTKAQRQRINYLFGQDRQLLRPQMLEKTAEEIAQENPFIDAEVVETFTFEKAGAASFSGFQASYSVVDGIINVVPSGKDPSIIFGSTIQAVSTEKANVIKIRARIDGDQPHVSNLFFRNGAEEFSADKAAQTECIMGEWKDYYFDFRGNKNWTGDIVGLRYDPAEYQCELVQIESVSFLYAEPLPEPEPEFTVDISGKVLEFNRPIDRTNFGVVVPIYPEKAIFRLMKTTHTWDKNTKTLTLKNANHTVSHVVGTDVMTVDGKEEKLYCTTYMFDGLPMLPIDQIAKALGYFPVTHEDGYGLSIMLGSAEEYDIIKNRVFGEFEFELENDLEGWTAQNSTAVVKDGVWHGTSTNNDPIINSPGLNFSAEKYQEIVVKMKWDIRTERSSYNSSIYFKTPSLGLSESRRITVNIPQSSNGEYVEVVFPAGKHLQWVGTINAFRLDPFDGEGTFDIEYIRLRADQKVLEQEKLQAEYEKSISDTIVNGDASSDFNVMFSDNATVSIVETEDGERVYDLKAAGGKVWTYLRQKVKFEPGATYVVEFDARMIGLNTGDTREELQGNIHFNLIYDNGKGGSTDHPKHVGAISMANGGEWMHFSGELTVGSDCLPDGNQATIFVNPIENCGVNYQVDNFKLTKK